MYKYIFILILLNNTLSFGQAGIFELYASDSTDNDSGWAIQSDSTGYTIGTGSICGGEGNCFRIIRLDNNGNIVWERFYQDNNALYYAISIRSIIRLKDGNYITFGTRIVSVGVGEVFILKFNSEGDSLWTKSYQSPETFWAEELIEDDNGNLLLNAYGGENFERSIWKLDSEGNELWHYDYLDDYGGSSYGNMVLLSTGELLSTYPVISAPEFEDTAAVSKYSAEGTLLWTKLYNELSLGFGRCFIQETIDGNYLLLSNTLPSNKPTIITQLLDTAGNIIEEHIIEKIPATLQCFTFTPAPDGTFVGIGRKSRFNIPDEDLLLDDDDAAWVFRLSATGELLWERHYTNIGHEFNQLFFFLDVTTTYDNRIAISMFVNPNETDLAIPGLIVLDENGCFTPDCDTTLQLINTPVKELGGLVESKGVIVSPNPASNEVSFLFTTPLPAASSLQQYNASGQLLRSESLSIGSTTHTLDVATLPNGLYFWQVGRESGKVIIQH